MFIIIRPPLCNIRANLFTGRYRYRLARRAILAMMRVAATSLVAITGITKIIAPPASSVRHITRRSITIARCYCLSRQGSWRMISGNATTIIRTCPARHGYVLLIRPDHIVSLTYRRERVYLCLHRCCRSLTGASPS